MGAGLAQHKGDDTGLERLGVDARWAVFPCMSATNSFVVDRSAAMPTAWGQSGTSIKPS